MYLRALIKVKLLLQISLLESIKSFILEKKNEDSVRRQLWKEKFKKRSFIDANMRKFNLDLQNVDVNPVLNETKTNHSYMLLADRYHQVFDKSFPLIQLNNNNKNSWFD